MLIVVGVLVVTEQLVALNSYFVFMEDFVVWLEDRLL
jgi:hypothetical protein